MSLYTLIKADSLSARKNRDATASAVLTTLLGEVETMAKNIGHTPTDIEVQSVIKKFIKNIDESTRANQSRGNTEVVSTLTHEKALLEKYLPKQLSEAELMAIIAELVAAGATNIGSLMKMLKQSYEGLYDGATASKIAKGFF